MSASDSSATLSASLTSCCIGLQSQVCDGQPTAAEMEHLFPFHATELQITPSYRWKNNETFIKCPISHMYLWHSFGDQLWGLLKCTLEKTRLRDCLANCNYTKLPGLSLMHARLIYDVDFFS